MATTETTTPPVFGPGYAKNVMFLCNHNSCRSQMAEGWLRHLRGEASVGVARCVFFSLEEEAAARPTDCVCLARASWGARRSRRARSS
mmetsp:Transcript_23429/g.92869  ORF Transcript_23429/g.92869 Transcript_23429/m.92869 type:complete len:88 (+) Transcript_23429:67-330(+)